MKKKHYTKIQWTQNCTLKHFHSNKIILESVDTILYPHTNLYSTLLSLYFHKFISLKILKFGRPSRGARSDETESSGSVQQFWVPQGWWTKGSSFAFRCQLSQLSTFKDGAGLVNSLVPLGGHRHTSANE